jgi:signal transduction histidine kinase
MKHGGAKHIRVKMSAENVMLISEIWNDGAAPESFGEHGYGLKKIRSYVEGSGGSLSFRSGDGFAVTIELPLGGLE